MAGRVAKRIRRKIVVKKSKKAVGKVIKSATKNEVSNVKKILNAFKTGRKRSKALKKAKTVQEKVNVLRRKF